MVGIDPFQYARLIRLRLAVAYRQGESNAKSCFYIDPVPR